MANGLFSYLLCEKLIAKKAHLLNTRQFKQQARMLSLVYYLTYFVGVTT